MAFSSSAVIRLLALLALALCGSAQPVTTGTTVAQTQGGSSLTAFPSPTNGLVSVQVVLAACTGLQIHTHNESELLLASPGNAGAIKVAYVNEGNKLVAANVQPGGRFAIPAGLVHYQYNPGCSPASFSSTLKIDANTQLVLSALSAVPASDYSVYATTPAAVAVPGFFATSSTCTRGCGGGNRKLL